MNTKKISVIVPNYNYARYIEERINSILEQTYPIYELIILDDASTDDSVEVINNIIQQNSSSNIKFEVNKKNSGSVFKQWIKGIEMATGDFIWIAEADDLSSSIFLEKVMAGFDRDDEVILSYCQSSKIDEDGKIFENDYLISVKEIDSKKWKSPYIRNGIDEICDSLIVKCTIPNVSAAVFKKVNTDPIVDEVFRFKLAGDWRFYVWILEQGKISFWHEALNLHRFHSNSVRETVNKKRDHEEFLEIQDFILDEFEVSKEVRVHIDPIRKAIKMNIQALDGSSYETYLSTLLKKVEKFNSVSIYGSGVAAKNVIQFLHNKKVKPTCVIEEKNIEKIGEGIEGVPIVSLQDAIAGNRVEVLVIASNYYQDEIYERIKYLNSEGIRVLKIIE